MKLRIEIDTSGPAFQGAFKTEAEVAEILRKLAEHIGASPNHGGIDGITGHILVDSTGAAAGVVKWEGDRRVVEV